MLQKFYSASGPFYYIFVQSLAQYTNIIKHNGSTFESEQSSRQVLDNTNRALALRLKEHYGL